MLDFAFDASKKMLAFVPASARGLSPVFQQMRGHTGINTGSVPVLMNPARPTVLLLRYICRSNLVHLSVLFDRIAIARLSLGLISNHLR